MKVLFIAVTLSFSVKEQVCLGRYMSITEDKYKIWKRNLFCELPAVLYSASVPNGFLLYVL